MTSAPDPGTARRPVRLAFWGIGFRPLYLFAAIFSALAILCWVAQFAQWTGSRMLIAGSPWHAHEMIFGYAFAVRNWTNRPTPSGAMLGAIAGLWLASRVLALSPWPLLAALPDAAFAIAVAAGIGVPLARSRNRRNYFFVALIVVFGIVNLGFYLAMAGSIRIAPQRGLHGGLDLILLLMTVMGGRVIPMFTANAVAGAGALRYKSLEYVAFASVFALLTIDMLNLPAPFIAVAAGWLPSRKARR